MAQAPSAETGCSRSRPSAVRSYSTPSGLVGMILRVTSPSRSSPRKVSVSIRCEMPPISRRSSLKRLVPVPSFVTTRTDHLSPTRDSTSLTARQSAGKSVCLGFNFVPSCGLSAVTYLALVTLFTQGSIYNQDARHDKPHPRRHRRQQPPRV